MKRPNLSALLGRSTTERRLAAATSDTPTPPEIVAPPSTSPSMISGPTTPIRRKAPSKTIERASHAYDQLGMSLALLLAITIALALWVAGAYFTLAFLNSMGLALAAAGWFAWLVPAAITASELWLWPREGTRWQQVLFFALVLLFDVGSSWAGLMEWGAGRHIPLFAGFTIPAGGWQLHALALVLGLILAFTPEKLGRWALSEFWRLWR